MTTKVNPLTQAHYDALNQGQRALHDAVQLAAAAKATGMDTRAHDELINFLQAQIGAIKMHFFPNGKPKS